MMKIFKEYINILGYIITGILFGFCSFILFINLYHYRSVNEKYINDSDNKITSSIVKQKIEIIKNNTSSDINNYKGNSNINDLASAKSRINSCAKVLDNEKMYQIIDKEQLDIYDVYKFQQYYQMEIANECLIKQLYELALPEENNKIDSLNLIKPFLYDNINRLKDGTDYVKKVLKSNSNYYFTSDVSKSDIYDIIGDSYNEVLNNYLAAINVVSDVSAWYKKEIGG